MCLPEMRMYQSYQQHILYSPIRIQHLAPLITLRKLFALQNLCFLSGAMRKLVLKYLSHEVVSKKNLNEMLHVMQLPQHLSNGTET